MTGNPKVGTDSLRELERAVSAGPWVAEPIGSEGYAVYSPHPHPRVPSQRLRVAHCTWGDWETVGDNARFIAESRNRLPALLDLWDAARALSDNAEGFPENPSDYLVSRELHAKLEAALEALENPR